MDRLSSKLRTVQGRINRKCSARSTEKKIELKKNKKIRVYYDLISSWELSNTRGSHPSGIFMLLFFYHLISLGLI